MKRYAVVFTPRAERQLDRLYNFIADQSGRLERKASWALS